MSANNSALNAFKAYYAKIEDLRQAAKLLGWDQNVYMPSGAAEARGQQLATLNSLIHEMTTSQNMKDLLESAQKEQQASSSDNAIMLQRAQRKLDKASKLPSEFVEALTKQRAKASSVWVKARQTNDFKMFEPELTKMFELVRKQADYLGFDDHPYDALHDLYEMGSSVAQLRTMFAELRNESVELLKDIAAAPQLDDSLIQQAFDIAKQQELSLDVAERLGFDFEHGRLDSTVHPFAQDVSKYDVRITTRYWPKFLNAGLFGTMHEAGHGMYEQGISEAYYHTPLGEAVSLGMHESQSRLWENLVGRSYGFWEGYYPSLQARFPEQLGQAPLNDFYAAINKVEPSLIRVEADEVTYNLHILIRFELELALLEDSLSVAELPEAWNEKYQQYLGITPPNNSEGCLQDIHWSEALIGYFPTYTLGNLMSVQLFEAAKNAEPTIDADMKTGDFSKLFAWLRANIHEQGSKFEPKALIQNATQKELSAKPYINYLNTKFRALYKI